MPPASEQCMHAALGCVSHTPALPCRAAITTTTTSKRQKCTSGCKRRGRCREGGGALAPRVVLPLPPPLCSWWTQADILLTACHYPCHPLACGCRCARLSLVCPCLPLAAGGHGHPAHVMQRLHDPTLLPQGRGVRGGPGRAGVDFKGGLRGAQGRVGREWDVAGCMMCVLVGRGGGEGGGGSLAHSTCGPPPPPLVLRGLPQQACVAMSPPE